MDRLQVGVLNLQGQGDQAPAEDLFRGQGILADDDPGVLPVAPISALERPRVCSAVNFCPDRSLYSRVRVRGYTVVSARFRPRARLRVRLSPPARGSRYLTEGEFRGRILFPRPGSA